jgi:hypothetical protein
MGEWDENRADILGRKIKANIPPAVWVPTTGQTILLGFVLGVPVVVAFVVIFLVRR